jgi:hypothetical protein
LRTEAPPVKSRTKMKAELEKELMRSVLGPKQNAIEFEIEGIADDDIENEVSGAMDAKKRNNGEKERKVNATVLRTQT